MAISADAAMAQLLDWVNNGNPMPDDSDDDDLDDLYGEDTVVRVPECHSGDEGSNHQSDTDSDEDESPPPQHPVRRTHPEKTLTSNRLVHSIDSCLDKCNFNEYDGNE